MSRLSTLSRSIAGSVAIITGAASGMGRATAHLFADEGARLGLLDVNAQGLEAVAEEIRAAGGEVLPLVSDRNGKRSAPALRRLRRILAASIFS